MSNLTEKDLIFLETQERQIDAMNINATTNEELANAIQRNAEAHQELSRVLKEFLGTCDMTGWTLTEAISNLAVGYLRNTNQLK